MADRFSKEVRAFIELEARIGKNAALIQALRHRAHKKIEPLLKRVAASEKLHQDLVAARSRLKVGKEEIDSAIKALDELNSEMTGNPLTTPDS